MRLRQAGCERRQHSLTADPEGRFDSCLTHLSSFSEIHMFYCATTLDGKPIRIERYSLSTAQVAMAIKLARLSKKHSRNSIDQAVRDIVAGPCAN